ncbi:MAG: FtsX-like permease family protein [Deferrisomatales bacterium]|nr:FtsX-like permease family protein [Deferrisomatales bacterium]
MTFLRLAFRNVLRNRRRSLVTVLAVAIGYMAVGVFDGYMQDAYHRIQVGAVFLEAPGHVVVFKKGFLQEGKLDPSHYMFSAKDLKTIRKVIEDLPGVVWVAPKLALSGLITDGDRSTVFIADAMEPSDVRKLWENFPFKSSVYAPKMIPEDVPFAALLAPQLADLLQLRLNSDAVLMSTTQFGQMNAVDIQVAGFMPPIAEGLDDKYVKISLSLGRSLYDFDGADRLCVLLENVKLTDDTARYIEKNLAMIGYDVDAHTWNELSAFYEKVTGYLNTVFTFIFCIVSIIVVTGTFNTMSMVVYERTREIGTLRSMGMKARMVIVLFSVEGAILGFFGSLVGLLLTFTTYFALLWADLSYTPPGVADKVTIQINLAPETLVWIYLLFVGLSILSALIPARRAAGQNIVDALGHV